MYICTNIFWTHEHLNLSPKFYSFCRDINDIPYWGNQSMLAPFFAKVVKCNENWDGNFFLV